MPLLLFDFQCSECQTIFEELVPQQQRILQCPECGDLAERIISGTHLNYTAMATSGDGMETAIDKFDKAHRQRKAIEERKYRDHGDYGASPGAD